MGIVKKLQEKARRSLMKSGWEVLPTLWPYPEGWGTWHPATRTVLDTGLSRDEAIRRGLELNGGKSVKVARLRSEGGGMITVKAEDVA